MILVPHVEQEKEVSASGWDIYDTFASQRRRSIQGSHTLPGSSPIWDIVKNKDVLCHTIFGNGVGTDIPM